MTHGENADNTFWRQAIAEVPRETIEAWVKELHPDASALWWVEVNEEGPETLTWLTGNPATHHHSLWLWDPPAWLVMRVLRTQRDQMVATAMTIIGVDTGCPAHTGDNTPPLGEFLQTVEGECLLCLIAENRELKGAVRDYLQHSSLDGAPVRISKRERLRVLALGGKE